MGLSYSHQNPHSQVSQSLSLSLLLLIHPQHGLEVPMVFICYRTWRAVFQKTEILSQMTNLRYYLNASSFYISHH